jgi:hypothetical protein
MLRRLGFEEVLFVARAVWICIWLGGESNLLLEMTGSEAELDADFRELRKSGITLVVCPVMLVWTHPGVKACRHVGCSESSANVT